MTHSEDAKQIHGHTNRRSGQRIRQTAIVNVRPWAIFDQFDNGTANDPNFVLLSRFFGRAVFHRRELTA
ncbi:MAG TPA: hypothetical protein PLY87_01260 [Planctomycetaceae bacterium]|nr:hypothetical protein [Planctomycetaceae bacterium]HQZ63665.1 hypothetical protein [Planctomycetaceae bacterium]